MTARDGTVRAFVAVTPDAAALAAVEVWRREVADAVDGVRWVPASQWHVTLRFLGETPAAAVEGLVEGLGHLAARCSPFPAVLRGAGVFPPRGEPRVLWVGVEADEALRSLRDGVEAVVRSLGFPEEERPFLPHLTLARAGAGGSLAGARPRVAGVRDRVWGRWEVRGFTLFRSELRPAGAVHRPLAQFNLGGA